jgi:hypothetical protein
MNRIVVGSLTLLVAGLAGIDGAAAAAVPPRVAIEGFRGPQADRIQGAVETGLLGRYYVVPDFSVEEAARASGVGLVIDDEFAQVAKALDVRAFVSAQIAKHRKAGWQVRLLVRRGDTGAPVGRILVAGRRLDRLERELSQRTSRRLEALFARAPASGAIEPPPTTEAELQASDVDRDPEEAPSGRARGPQLFEVSVDGRVFSRTFSYAQNLSGLPEYGINRAMATALGVVLHPALSLAPAYARIGITAGLEYGVGVGTRSSDSDERRNGDVHGYSVGLRYLLDSGAFELAPELGYGLRAFTTGDADTTAPDVRYSLVSGGATARAELGDRLGAMVRASYLHVLSAGPLTEGNRFSRATVSGVELEASIGFALMTGLEARASVGLRRFGFDMGSRPGDAWVAGGAVDQTTWAGIGLAYRPTSGAAGGRR